MSHMFQSTCSQQDALQTKQKLEMWPELLSIVTQKAHEGRGDWALFISLSIATCHTHTKSYNVIHASDTSCDCTGEYNLRLGITKELHPELVSTHQGKFPKHVGQVDYKAYVIQTP